MSALVLEGTHTLAPTAAPLPGAAGSARDLNKFADILGEVDRGGSDEAPVGGDASPLRFNSSLESTLAALGAPSSDAAAKEPWAKARAAGTPDAPDAAQSSWPPSATAISTPIPPALVAHASTAIAPSKSPAASASPLRASPAATTLAGAAGVVTSGLPAAKTRGGAAGATASASATRWDLSGAFALQDLLSADPMLGLQSLQLQTHLAVADSLPVGAGAGLASGANAAADTAPQALAVASSNAVVANAASPAPAPTPVSLSKLPQFIADQASGMVPPSSSTPAAVAPRRREW